MIICFTKRVQKDLNCINDIECNYRIVCAFVIRFIYLKQTEDKFATDCCICYFHRLIITNQCKLHLMLILLDCY